MEQHTAHNDAAAPADIFDMEAHHKAPRGQDQVPPAAGAAPADQKPNVSRALLDRLLNLSPRHWAMITAAIIVTGLVLSRLTGSAPESSSGNDQLLPTNFQQPPTPPAAQHIPAAAPPSAEQHPAQQDQSLPPAAPMGESERTIIRTALEDLNARVSRLEAGATQASANTAPIITPPVAAAAAPQRPVRTPATNKPAAVARAETLPLLTGYALNTIYQNQAWIEHDGATYAVQVGDKIGALRITGIDARARRVVTPDGQIR
ncbi:MAG: hypothetical protein K2X55_15385 [Burkholderiaceae bacterium]|nr:hypothetical protein [Burkholderiaceae bacterium]